MKDVKQFYIRQSHTSTFPTHLLFYDCETFTRQKELETHHRMDIGWTRYIRLKGGLSVEHDEWQLWDKSFPVMRYIVSKTAHKRSLCVFGHNIFFDLQSSDFFYWFPKWGWKLDFVYEKGLTYILIIHKEDRHLKLISTTNYFDTSLDEIGKAIGLFKSKVDFKNCTHSDLVSYCKRDVEIISEAMLQYMRFCQNHDAGKFCLTRASQSFAAYRHRFMPEKIHIHSHDHVKELERNAYFGGRTECFYFGEVPGRDFVFLDINSMYPYVMRNFPCPVKLKDYRTEVSDWYLNHVLNKYLLIASVDIETDVPLYAKRIKDKITFPIGRFHTYVCTAGLRSAVKAKHLKKIYELAVYRGADIFSDYVDYFYPLKVKYKREGNDIYLSTVKLYLNSLYGKFGQKKHIQEEFDADGFTDYYRIENYFPDTGEQNIEYGLFGKIIYQYGEEDARNTFTAIPAHITEYSRLLLWSIIANIGANRVLYCDTDSLVIRKADLPFVRYPIDDERIGSLSIDKSIKTFTINGSKDYELDGKRITKGIPKDAKYLGMNKYSYDMFLGQSSHMLKGISRYFVTVKSDRTVWPYYNKGIIEPDGKITPLILSEPSR